jgi:uncharacterized protein YdaU (DUF1376 family)
MNTSERSIYRDLLDHIYVDGPIPNDPNTLATLAGVSVDELEKAWPVVGKRFIPSPDDPNSLTNTNVEDELRLRAEKAGAGKLGGHAKAGKTLAGARQKKNKTETETKSKTEKEEKEGHSLSRSLSARETQHLSEFLALYPKKTSQAKAKRAYASVIDSSGFELAELMAGLRRWLKTEQWRQSILNDGGRFVPDPDRFLLDRLWLDHPPHRPGTMAEMKDAVDKLKE